MPKIDTKLAAQIAEQCEKEGKRPSDAFRKLDEKTLMVNEDGQLEFVVSMSKRDRELFEISQVANDHLLKTDPEKTNDPRITIMQLLVVATSLRVELSVSYPQLFKKIVTEAYNIYYGISKPEKPTAPQPIMDVKNVMPSMRSWIKDKGVALTGEATE